jgi:hypothetical protein
LPALALAMPVRAAAQDFQPGGAITGHFLIADGDLGGAGMLDVWAPFDWARIGGFVGAAATPSERDAHNRIFMPIGVSFAAHLSPTGDLSVELRARLGLWGGATQSEKLTMGVFAGGGAYLGLDLGVGAVFQVGADVWGVIASDAWRASTAPDDVPSASTWVIAPGVGFSWTPETT